LRMSEIAPAERQLNALSFPGVSWLLHPILRRVR
jgi:hypothetical protein